MMILMDSLGPTFDITKKILSATDDLTFATALTRLKEDEIPVKRAESPPAIQLGNVYMANNSGNGRDGRDGRCYECGSRKHWAAKCPTRKRGRRSPTPDSDSESSEDSDVSQEHRTHRGRRSKRHQQDRGQRASQTSNGKPNDQFSPATEIQASMAQLASIDSGEGVF